jgi:IPT/TIG domain
MGFRKKSCNLIFLIRIQGMTVRILFFILLSFFSNCKKDTTKSNPYAALLLGGKTPYSPTIYSIDPKRGNPSFTTPSSIGVIGTTYPATLVTIKGKNFIPSTTGNSVSFNGTPAAVEYATDQELRARVPIGAMSGVLSVSNNGGVCSSLDKKSGTNCEGQDFFVDCYGAYKNLYGAETAINTGTSQTISYDSLTTKAFRSDLLYTAPNSTDTAGNTINIRCASIVHVLLFSQACVPTEYTVNGTSLILNPVISVNSKFYTIQYILTATKGDCVIRVN